MKIKVKVLNQKENTSKYQSYSLKDLNFELTKEITEKPALLKEKIIKRYYVSCFKNKKQPQSTDKTAGRKKVETPSGTNKGMSRQPRGSNGRSRIVVNVPNAVGGGKALPFSINQKSTKVNRKQKKLAVKLIFEKVLKKSDIYFIDGHLEESKDSAFLKFLNTHGSKRLKEFLDSPVNKTINQKKFFKTGPLLISAEDKDPLVLRFKNYKNGLHLISEKKNNYFGMIKGYRVPDTVITTEQSLKKILQKIKSSTPLNDDQL